MLGVDIVEIDRLREMENFEAFCKKVFSAAELEYIRTKEPYETAAGLWAAKEAVAKALGRGFSGGFSPKSVEIAHDASGAPSARAGEFAFELSVSHERHYAVAVAMRRTRD